jgi:hypothetical protein
LWAERVTRFNAANRKALNGSACCVAPIAQLVIRGLAALLVSVDNQ